MPKQLERGTYVRVLTSGEESEYHHCLAKGSLAVFSRYSQHGEPWFEGVNSRGNACRQMLHKKDFKVVQKPTESVVQYKSSAKTKKPKKGRAIMKAGQDNIWVVEVTQDGKDVVYSRPATREVAREHKREAKQDGYTNVQIVQYKRGAVIR